MIDLYTWGTPNGRKVSIMLEETRLDYTVHPIDIEHGAQHSPGFLALNPNNKIPAIVDHDAPGGPLTVFESGAILLHLAERTGQYLSTDARVRSETLQWLFWQMGGFGPMLGQYNHFRPRTEVEASYGKTRYTQESLRLFGVLDKRLETHEFVAGPYSIADMAIFPWSISSRRNLMKDTGATFPNIDRWEKALAQRPAIGRGMSVLTPGSLIAHLL